MRGDYVLVVSVGEPACIKVGALGSVSFRRRLYAIVGSDQVGLQKRVARHLRRGKKRFWHIDYLLGSDIASVVRVFWKEGEKTEECHVAGVLGRRGVPVAGLGVQTVAAGVTCSGLGAADFWVSLCVSCV